MSHVGQWLMSVWMEGVYAALQYPNCKSVADVCLHCSTLTVNQWLISVQMEGGICCIAHPSCKSIADICLDGGGYMLYCTPQL